MIEIVIDENGNPINALELKNEEVKDELAEVLQEFLDEKEQMLAIKKVARLGYRFSKQLYSKLAKYPPMSVEAFASMDYETLNQYWVYFQDLTAYYNRYFEIVDNKQLFCAYAGLNSRQYLHLERHEDEAIRGLMSCINDAFVGLGFVAGESGDADAKAISTRLRAGGEAGHSVISAVEEKIIETSEGMSDTEFEARLAQRGVQLLN